MKDLFAGWVAEAQGFFTELAANNDRTWFEPRKELYRTRIRAPGEALAETLAGELSRLSGEALAGKVYRIHRDVRFSRDKSPYNAHLHILWSVPDAPASPGWFFGLSPEGIVVATGVVDLAGTMLDRWRALVDAEGASLAAALASAGRDCGAAIADWGTPSLKRVPAPYAADHPQAELLKRRSLVLSAPLHLPGRGRGLVREAAWVAGRMLPVWTLLRDGLRD
jgi:uncharacterized protein (TIGR02453 family)